MFASESRPDELDQVNGKLLTSNRQSGHTSILNIIVAYNSLLLEVQITEIGSAVEWALGNSFVIFHYT